MQAMFLAGFALFCLASRALADDATAPPTAPAAAAHVAAGAPTTDLKLPDMSRAERERLVAQLVQRRDALVAQQQQLAQCLDTPTDPLPDICRQALVQQANVLARQLAETTGGIAAQNGDFSRVLNPGPAPTPEPESKERGG